VILVDWVRDHPALVTGLGVLSAVMFLAGLVLTPVLVARLPADHFVRSGPPPSSWRRRHPGVRLLLRVAKNLLGGVLILAGIAMLVLPGQGLLTILVGLLLLDLPGERRLEVWFLKRPPVAKAVAWLRRRAGRDPLRLPGDEVAVSSPGGSEAPVPGEAKRP